MSVARVLRRPGLLALLVASTLARDSGADSSTRRPRTPESERTACEGNRPPLPEALFYELRTGAFPGSGTADVAVHVPPWFDATLRPGVVLYFHGWNGCVAQALADDDAPCAPDGDPRPGARLAGQLDEAGVNAILVAVELRVDLPTGEPGQLSAPGDVLQLLRELFAEHLAEPLGCPLEVEALDRVVLVAHSGGYQAVASALAFGELPRVSEVVLLDSLYGADAVFASWLTDALELQDEGAGRFVDLYTCCGGTLERSRSMARLARDAGDGRGPRARRQDGEARRPLLLDDDPPVSPATLTLTQLTRPVVIARVAESHAALPRVYFRPILESAGFARLHGSGSAVLAR